MATVCLFLSTGKTFTFCDAEIVEDSENALVVRYTAMSDGREGILRVRKESIVAHSVKE